MIRLQHDKGDHLMGVERIQVQTLADRAFDMLERAILNGDLAPGATLGEADLAGQLGISRGPLREAISRLEGRRLLQRVPHVGVRVVCLSDAEVAEIFAMREVLEGLAASLAAQYMTGRDIDMLEEAAPFRHRAPGRHGGQRHDPTEDFHVRIAQGSRNSRLIEYLCIDMYSLLQLYRIRSGSSPMRAGSAEEHREIVAALRARDGVTAERLMRAHVRRAKDSLNLASIGASASIVAADDNGAGSKAVGEHRASGPELSLDRRRRIAMTTSA
ncbi:GntR family transcriptional regulator [Acidisphaera sp. L21]|uniref:GntR family transcriptional regulator n=1 Tax=Acidisphaera sp. L21 TaxID=1641851 RepID=UPI00131D317D|nr:GntR family transcriptional regulator [Acidisphaera sp. L21]